MTTPTGAEYLLEIAWAAGFLEGEGSFGFNKSTQLVSAYQVNREPLERLERLFGGRIYLRDRHHRQTQPCHVWYITGAKARALMETMRPLMSRKRQDQIHAAMRNTSRTDEERAATYARRSAAGKKGYAKMQNVLALRREKGA